MSKKQISAVLNGNVKIWFIDNKKAATMSKYIIEIDIGSDKPYRWVSNILFQERFMRRRDVTAKVYSAY